MSLYALFPGNDPLTTTTSRQPTTTAASGGGTTCNSPSLYRPASPVSATEFGARHVVVDFSTMKTGSSSNNSGKRQIGRSDSFSTTDTTEALSMSSSSSLQDSHTTTTAAIKHDQQLKIQIENIKINFNKLCRVGGKSSSNSSCLTNKSNKKRPFSVSRSPKDGRLRRRSRTNAQIKNDNQKADKLTSYEKAIEFDLNIRYGGRSYVARRSLNQIAQLRQDLLEELSYHDVMMMDDDALDGSFCSASSTGSSDLDESYRSCMSTSRTTYSSASSACENQNDTTIPSLPRLSSENAAGSFGGGCGGFAQMNGMMQAYRPALESWFQKTTTTAFVSEDNPVLAHFLWEPMSSSSSSSSSSTALGSIHES